MFLYIHCTCNVMCRNLVLCGSMDRLAFILDLNQDEDMLLQKFEDHSKYVYIVLEFV